MKFSFSDEQEQFREVVRKFVQDRSPSSEVRRLMETDTAYDPEVWQLLSKGLGLQGVHIPEAYGGQGFGEVELCIAMEEFGRGLLCAPFFGSCVLAGTAILEAGNEADRERWLPELVSGDTIFALAIDEGRGLWGADGIDMVFSESNGSYVLQGKKSFVVDGAHADSIVVVARQPGTSGADGISFFIVSGTADGVTRRVLNTIDKTRPLAEIEFSNVTAEPLGALGEAGEALAKTLSVSSVALANEMIGGAQRLLASAVEYALLRVQFGRVIGSFQSIKHKCADLLLEVELAKSAAYCAADAVASNDAEYPALVALSKSLAADTYLKTATQTIQIHGGIGFTWENDTHLYFKRAKSSESLLGQPSWHREQMLRHWQI